MHAPAAPIHPLPDVPERDLLRAVLRFDADLTSVSVFTSTPVDEVTRWAHTEAVFAWIQAHTYFKTLAREHRELARANRTLDHLEELYKSTHDPVERRRILSAILRGGTAILRGRPAPAPSRIETPARTPQAAPAEPAPRAATPKRTPQRNDQPQREHQPQRDEHPEPAPSPPQINPHPSTTHNLTSMPAPAFDIALPSTPRPRPSAKRAPAHLLAAAGLPAP